MDTQKNGHPFERTTRYMAKPEILVIVGLDRKDDGSALIDERTTLPIDEDMVSTIMRHGVKKDILCRRNPATGDYEVVDGRQRTVNAREANRRLAANGESPIKVPIRVDKGSDDLMFELQIVLNRHVESTPLMKARTMERFYNRCGSRTETCRVCRISGPTFDNWMTLLQMDPEIHAAVDEGKISSSQALKFSKLTRVQQRKALQKFLTMKPKERRARKSESSPNKTDKTKMPSKAALLNIVIQDPESLDPNFLLGLKFALGLVSANEVPGLNEVPGNKK